MFSSSLSLPPLSPPFNLIIADLHGAREREVRAAVLAHVDVEAARPGHLLELALGPGSPPHVLQPEHRPEHLRQPHLRQVAPQARVRPRPEENVRAQRPLRVHCLRVREVCGVFGCADLRVRGGLLVLIYIMGGLLEVAREGRKAGK